MTDLFRVSFSILEPWSRGDYDESIRRWMHVETPPTQAMIDGSLLHKQWQDETNTTAKLPKVFGGTEMINPETELKLEFVMGGWLQFVGVIDSLEDGIIHEYKTGASNSMKWARTMQTRCYQLLLNANGIYPEKAIIHHFNQHTKVTTTSKIYLTENTAKEAEDWIETYGSELHEALKEAGEL